MKKQRYLYIVTKENDLKLHLINDVTLKFIYPSLSFTDSNHLRIIPKLLGNKLAVVYTKCSEDDLVLWKLSLNAQIKILDVDITDPGYNILEFEDLL